MFRVAVVQIPDPFAGKHELRRAYDRPGGVPHKHKANTKIDVKATYGVGILGLGVIGRIIGEQFRESPRFEVVAAFDPAIPTDPNYPMRSSAGEVAADPRVDCLYVATPPGLHAEGVHLAIAARKPVLCEKPLAPTPEEADRLAGAVRDANIDAVVNFAFAPSAIATALAAAVDQRRLGRPTGAHLFVRIREWPQPWQAAAGNWLTSPAQGGFTREVLTHFVALADRLFGPGLVNDAEVTRAPNGLETRTLASIAYERLVLTIDAALDPDLEHEDNLTNRFTIECERGVMGIEDWDIPINLAVDREAPQGVVPAMARMLDGARTDLADFDAGARVVRLIERILASPTGSS